MKYFDIDWIKGNLSDEEYKRRERDYALFIKKLFLKMNIAERIFADINYHDAKIISFLNKNNSLILESYIGDKQNGYFKLLVVFAVNYPHSLDKGLILTSEIAMDNNLFYFSFILANLKQYQIEFSKIIKIELSEIGEKDYLLS